MIKLDYVVSRSISFSDCCTHKHCIESCFPSMIAGQSLNMKGYDF